MSLTSTRPPPGRRIASWSAPHETARCAGRGAVVTYTAVGARAVTYSVGQVHLGTHCVSYCGTQSTTRNHHGAEVYGGSDLRVVRGGFAELLASNVPIAAPLAVMQVEEFDATLKDVFPTLTVSRNNYDVIQGEDAAGRMHSGVLEQSWRVGGASPAEIAAIEAFAANPELAVVRAAAFERYGEALEPPPHATVHFRGHDPRVGHLLKFTILECDEHTPRVLHHPG